VVWLVVRPPGFTSGFREMNSACSMMDRARIAFRESSVCSRGHQEEAARDRLTALREHSIGESQSIPTPAGFHAIQPDASAAHLPNSTRSSGAEADFLTAHWNDEASQGLFGSKPLPYSSLMNGEGMRGKRWPETASLPHDEGPNREGSKSTGPDVSPSKAR